MKLVLDNIIFSLQKSGGISVYWFELCSRILKQSEVNSLFIDQNDSSNFLGNQLRSNKMNAVNNGFCCFNSFRRYLDVKVSIKDRDSIFHSSYYRVISPKLKRKFNIFEIVTVHDFTYERLSSGLKKWIHSRQKVKAIKSADVVICVSESTKHDLLQFYPEFSHKDIRIVYNGVSVDYKIISVYDESAEHVPFLLFVGSRSSYKNFDFVVECVSLFDNLELKVVGTTLTKNEIFLLDSSIPGRWYHYQDLNNRDLNALYNKAFALIYPSSYEGFGIPIVEAMRAGCPFISLKGSSITEIANDAGFLMSALNIEEFSRGIFYIRNNRDEIIQKGLLQSNRFSWDLCFYETLEIYREFDSKFRSKKKH